MKDTSSDLLASGRKRHAIKFTRTDGTVYAFTEGDTDATIDGVTYSAEQGFVVSSLESSADASVGNLELTTIDDGSLFSVEDLVARRWEDAAWVIFWYDWSDTSLGTEVMTSGTVGEITRKNGQIVLELRDLKQYIQQTIGNPSSKTCRARFADYPSVYMGNKCRLDADDYWVTGTVTSVTSRRVFVASALTQAEDWFGQGIVIWTSGNNAGLSYKASDFASGGTFTLAQSTVAAIAVGDTFKALAGCSKRLDEDCAAKFSNTLNFCGEPHRPTTDDLTSSASVDV